MGEEFSTDPCPDSEDFTDIEALAELAQLKQWVTWNYVEREPGSKPTKVPHPPGFYRGASATDPDDWGGWQEALDWVEHARRPQMDGVGFVFTADDLYWGIDLDGCVDPETGRIDDWACEVLLSVKTYTEISPSGTGLKLFGLGPAPGRSFNRRPCEFYSQGRFFTVTGQHVYGTPDTLEVAALGLTWFYDLHGPGGDETATGQLQIRSGTLALTDGDELLLDLARSASESFALLYDLGEWYWLYASHSEADLALVGRLAYWTHGNAERVDRLFRHSALYRSKWDENRGPYQTYGERTIEVALSNYDGNGSAGGPDHDFE